MYKKSFLLAIDGSAESLYAAEAAWALARGSSAKVVAQAVLDNQALWEMVGQDVAGMIGSGPYLSAYEATSRALRAVSESLLEAYESRAAAQGVESECTLDEGNTTQEICRRALDHDMVIVGHRAPRVHSPRHDRRRFVRYSLCERLSYYCTRPLLILQQPYKGWSRIRLVLSANNFKEETITQFLSFTSTLDLDRELYFVADENIGQKLVKSTRKRLAEEKRLLVTGWSSNESDGPWECALDVSPETLLAVTTLQNRSDRVTCEGTEIDSFIRYMRAPAILLWPIEYAGRGTKEKVAEVFARS